MSLENQQQEALRWLKTAEEDHDAVKAVLQRLKIQMDLDGSIDIGHAS